MLTFKPQFHVEDSEATDVVLRAVHSINPHIALNSKKVVALPGMRQRPSEPCVS